MLSESTLSVSSIRIFYNAFLIYCRRFSFARLTAVWSTDHHACCVGNTVAFFFGWQKVFFSFCTPYNFVCYSVSSWYLQNATVNQDFEGFYLSCYFSSGSMLLLFHIHSNFNPSIDFRCPGIMLQPGNQMIRFL